MIALMYHRSSDRCDTSVAGSCASLLPICLLLALVVAVDGATIPVADFGASIQTAHGGFFRSFGGTPNQVADRLTTIGEPAADAWRIDLTAKAPASGAGALIPLFDERAPGTAAQRRIIPGWNLCLRMVGALSNRRLQIEIVSGTNSKAVGRAVGTVGDRQLNNRSWQTIRLPIPRRAGLDQRGGFIRIVGEGNGPAWFAIAAIVLSRGEAR